MNLDLFKEFDIEYDGVEYDGLDEKIEKQYNKKASVCKEIISNFCKKYPTLPINIKSSDDIDLAVFIDNKEIDFQSEEINSVESKYSELEHAIKLLIEARFKLSHIEKSFKVIKTSASRLLYLCEMLKREQGCSSDLIHNVDYRALEKPHIYLPDKTIKPIGRIEYTNWSTVLHTYVTKYKVTDKNGVINYVCANIPEQYLNDPDFLAFFNKTMLNKDYMEYAQKYNGGYLGEPEKTEEGNYRVTFNNEDIAACIEFEKSKHDKTPSDRIK